MLPSSDYQWLSALRLSREDRSRLSLRSSTVGTFDLIDSRPRDVFRSSRTHAVRPIQDVYGGKRRAGGQWYCAARRSAARPDGESSRSTVTSLRGMLPPVQVSIDCCACGYAGFLRCRPPAAAKRTSHTKNESEVIPVAVVLHLVDVHRLGEQRHDEGDRADQSLPQAQPEASRIWTGVDELVRPGGSGRQQQRRASEQYRPSGSGSDRQNPS
jgi:hypothetical protein